MLTVELVGGPWDGRVKEVACPTKLYVYDVESAGRGHYIIEGSGKALWQQSVLSETRISPTN